MNRVGTGEAMIRLAIVALVMAALLPSYRARAFDGLVEGAVADVEALRQATTRARTANGAWPAAAPAGQAPDGAAGAFPGESALVRDGYTLEWRLWERVEEVLAPPRALSAPVLDDDEQPRQGGTVAGDAPPDSAAAEVIELARTEGAVVVHTPRRLLLAELLRRYGEDVSSFGTRPGSSS